MDQPARAAAAVHPCMMDDGRRPPRARGGGRAAGGRGRPGRNPVYTAVAARATGGGRGVYYLPVHFSYVRGRGPPRSPDSTAAAASLARAPLSSPAGHGRPAPASPPSHAAVGAAFLLMLQQLLGRGMLRPG